MKISKLGVVIRGIAVVLAAAALGLQGQTLPITNGLQLWLKADAGVATNAAGLVTNWVDQSGNGNNAAPTNNNTAYSPTYAPDSLNGLPTLRFPGGAKALDVPDISTSPTSTISSLTNNVTIILLKEDDNYSGYRAGVAKTQGNGPYPFDFYNNSGVDAGDTIFYLNPNGAYASYIGNSFKPQPGVYQVMSFTYANGSVTHYLNDAVAANFNAAMQPNASPSSILNCVNSPNPLRLGSREDFVTQLVGNMAEVLIYQPALTTGQLMEVVTNYLKPKWNLQFDPPPLVAITSPTNGGTALANTIIPISIDASSPTGMVTTVTLYGNGRFIATTATPTPPYSLGISALTPGALTLTAVAVDQIGRPATSAPVNITITGPAAPSSPPTNNLMVWLNAGSGVSTNSDGTVATWTDESKNGNDATATNNLPYDSLIGTVSATLPPVYEAGAVNGQPALHFNGTNSLLTVADPGTAFLAGDFTTFVVARFSQAFFSFSQTLWSKASNNLACPFDWSFPSGQSIVWRGNGALGYGSAQVGATLAAPLDQFVNVGVASQGSTVTMYSGAGAIYSNTIASPAGDGAGSLPLTIGMRDDGSTGLYGDIAEILIYSGAQSASNVAAIASYLNGKYNLAQAFYASPPPVVSVSAPANGAVLAAPITVPCTVSASSSLGFITSVALYANGAKINTFTNAPYTVQLDLLTPGTVTFTAIATDNWGIQSTSPPVVVTLTGSVSAPPFTNGLGIWLKPDAGVVTNTSGNVIEWDDQSGNANNAYQPSNDGSVGIPPLLLPGALNGFPVLHFTPPANEAGSNVFLDIADNGTVNASASSSFAIFAVTRIPAYNSYYEILADCNPNGPGYANPFEYRINSGTGLADFILGNGASDPAALTASVAPPASSNFFTIEGVVVANGTITHFLEFNANGSTTFNYTAVDSGYPIRVGGRGASTPGNVYSFNGDIAEMQVFTTAPDNAQVSQIFNYLSHKYALAQVQIAAVPPAITVTPLTNGVTPSITNMTAPGIISLGAQIASVAPLSSVTFIINGQVVSTQTSPPYQIPLSVLTPGSLSVVVRAVDIYGIGSNSLPYNITIPGTAGALPTAPSTNGLVLWLKADEGVSTNADGTVATWADQSGNSNNATTDSFGAAAPSLRTDPSIGRPVVTFNPNGAPMCLDVADAPSVELTSDMSIFYAAEFTNFSYTTLPSTIVAKTFGSSAFPFDYQVNASQALYYRGNANGTSSVGSSGPVPAGQYVVGGVTVSVSLVSHYLDNIANGFGSLGYGAEDGGSPLKVGSRDDFLTQFAGNMGEILLYNRALSGDDLQLADTYLAGKYGIASFQIDTQAPGLTITPLGGGAVQIAWAAGYSGWTLEGSTNLRTWSTVASNPANNQVTAQATGVATFYRLQGQ